MKIKFHKMSSKKIYESLLKMNKYNKDEASYEIHFLDNSCNFEEIIKVTKTSFNKIKLYLKNNKKKIDFKYNLTYVNKKYISIWFENYIEIEKLSKPVDTLLKIKVYSHGLLAFNKTNDIKNIKNINEKWEICCSDKNEPIGPLGVYIKGNVLLASTIDLYSFLRNGKRCVNPYSDRLDGICYDLKTFLKKEWDHKEIITNKNKIVGVWVKKWAPKNIEEAAKDLAKHFGVKIYKVSSRKEKKEVIL